MLYLYDNETDMCNAFLDHLEECDPDILTAHAGHWADIPKLMERLPDPRRLSPIGEIVKPHAKYGYKETKNKGTRFGIQLKLEGMNDIDFIWCQTNLERKKLVKTIMRIAKDEGRDLQLID